MAPVLPRRSFQLRKARYRPLTSRPTFGSSMSTRRPEDRFWPTWAPQLNGVIRSAVAATSQPTCSASGGGGLLRRRIARCKPARRRFQPSFGSCTRAHQPPSWSAAASARSSLRCYPCTVIQLSDAGRIGPTKIRLPDVRNRRSAPAVGGSRLCFPTPQQGTAGLWSKSVATT